MSLFHAVVWMDHQQAQVLQFDAESVQAQRVKAHSHHPRHHGTDTRALHVFFEQLVGALSGVQEVLLVGPAGAPEEFKTWVARHQAALLPRLVGTEPADHPTEAQLVALARRYFLKYDRMAGTPTPM